jgi:hypothetical protein
MASVTAPQTLSRRASSETVLAAAGMRRPQALSWFAGGAALAFVVSYIGSDVLELHHDLYYLVYISVMGVFLASFLAHTRRAVAPMLRTNLVWSLVLGAVLAGALAQVVMQDPSTTHPSGLFYGFELVWRGIAYGTMDALILFVFPAAVAYIVVNGDRSGAKRKVAFAALTLALSFGITATYHLGYQQFRGSDLVKPEVGALFANVPAALTGNPLGAVIAHGVYHVTANVHTYRSGVFLPPALDGYTERGSGTAGLGLALAWIILAGCIVWWQRRRLFPSQQHSQISMQR